MKAAALVSAALLTITTAASAQPIAEPYVSGILFPSVITHANDASDRLFVAGLFGEIRIVDPQGNLLPDPFLDVSSLVSTNGERGLLGLAFHPDYANNGKFYINYTDTQGDTVVAEYHVSDTDPNQANPTARIILTIDQPFANHNGGWIGFGPDDYLYIAMGDGGTPNTASSLDQLLGKVLRIDIDNTAAPLEYAIPADNPWANDGDPNTRAEIWHYGLRNPWRCSFDRDTGDLWIADVGQFQYEEVNHQPAGQGGNHYGWRCREATHPSGAPNCPADNPLWVDPVHEYGRSDGCSVTGGTVYRGCELGPDYQGMYFFSDYCSGTVWYLDPQDNYTRSTAFDTNVRIIAFGEDQDGELYYASITDNTVYKLTLADPPDKNDNGIIDTCEGTVCKADLTDDGALDFFDLSAFLGYLADENPIADFTGDAEFDFFDVSAFLTAFSTGCP
jgi:glucose/arabinose dehydrogenase